MMELLDVYLKDIQSWMQAVLINPAFKSKTVMTSGEGLSVERLIKPSSRMSAAGRLNIYGQGYYARLLECLSAQFRVLKHTMGKELFNDFCRAYLVKYPSSSYTLGHLGNNFSRFLRETQPETAETKATTPGWAEFLIEIAELEWAIYSLFDAPNCGPYGTEDEATLEELLQLADHSQLFHFSFPVHRYYKAVTAGLNPSLSTAGESFLALIRKNYKIGVFEIGREHYDSLKLSTK